jgi:excisionase family DNA binding protein
VTHIQNSSHLKVELAPIYVSPKEAARLMGIGKTKLYEELDSGRLPSFKSGRKRLIAVADIFAWKDQFKQAES